MTPERCEGSLSILLYLVENQNMAKIFPFHNAYTTVLGIIIYVKMNRDRTRLFMQRQNINIKLSSSMDIIHKNMLSPEPVSCLWCCSSVALQWLFRLKLRLFVNHSQVGTCWDFLKLLRICSVSHKETLQPEIGGHGHVWWWLF